MTGQSEQQMTARSQGWGTVAGANAAHYFGADGRSLCGRWLAIGVPRWAGNQTRGPEPRRNDGTCKACWRKAPEGAP
jgi:hypothetical protein